MKLRSHLLLLTAGTLLPLVVFAVAAIVLIGQRERDLFERGARERTLALLTAVDAELQGHANSLRALSVSPLLEAGELGAFHAEMVREARVQPGWHSVRLNAPDGRRLLDSASPFGVQSSISTDTESFEAALESGQPIVGSLDREDSGFYFRVRVPVFAAGEIEAVLTVLVDPGAMVSLLERQRLPTSWVGVVLDGHDRIVVRTVAPTESVGKPASESLRQALARAPEGWFAGTTIEGMPVYTPYNRSSWSGWTVAIGIPREVVVAAATQTTGLLTLGIVAAAALAAILAVALGRRIERPIVSLAATANALRTGAPIAPAATDRVQEVHDLSHALVEAAREVRERESALRAADRAKDEFLAMLGHELRNPLSALSSAGEILRRTAPQEGPAKAAPEIVVRQVDHMTRLVDDLLDVSRVSTGRVKLSRQPIELAARARAALESMREAGQLERHAIAVETDPVWVDADPARVEQIVSNLLGNAVKFTPERGRIALRVARDGGEAVLEVRDEGTGLAAELVPRVFDLFVQGERSLDRSQGGLGIGLTLVKRLAELHGGRAFAASEGPGRGATFTVRLPAIEAPERSAPEAALPASERTVRRRILLVEDNEDARRSLAAALLLQGHEVREAATGPAGVEAAAQWRPDAAVIDIGLPELDGYGVAHRIRAELDGRAPALIALTGYGQQEQRRRALDAGFDEHLTKPVPPDRLARVIESAIAARERAAASET